MRLTTSLSDPEDAGLILRTLSDLSAVVFFATDLRGGAFGGRPLSTGLELSTSFELGPFFLPESPGRPVAPLVEPDSGVADPSVAEAYGENKNLI